MMDIRSAARALEGDVIAGGQVVFRAPGHSRADRSASVRFGPKFGPDDPDDFMVNSFAGDPFDALRDHVKERLLGSARSRRSDAPKPERHTTVANFDVERAKRKARAVEIWKGAQDPRGTIVEIYLDSRWGLTLTDDIAVEVIRFHPACPWKEGDRTLFVPAMVAVMRNIRTDEITGIHRRRLTPEGRKVGKPKMMGIASDAAIKIDADETVSHGLGIAEGVETALTARQLGWRPMWAGGSEGAIRTFPILSGIECITLHAENDENGANARAIHECASRWHAANREVIVVEPKAGKDLNDALGASPMHKEIPGPTPDADRISTSRVWSPKVIEGTDAHGPRQRREDERYSRKASDIIRSAADLEHQVFAPIRYFVAGYIAEGCTILAGAPKLGKSWLALEIALAIATGGTCLGGISCEQGDVLYLALEDNERRIKSRVGKVLRSMHGADAAWPSRFNYVSLDRKFPHAGDGGLAMIEQWLQSAKAPRAVVIDVLQKFRAPSRGNKEGQYEADYRAVGELQALAAKYQVAIIVVHHVRKAPGEGDPFERISGTNGISGAADTAIVMVRDGRGTTIYARGRDIEEVENAVEFNKGDCVWVVLGAAADIRKSDERRELLASLKEAGEPKKPSEVAAALGRKVSTITNLLAKMASSGEVVKAGYGKYAHPDVAISAYVRSRAGE